MTPSAHQVQSAVVMIIHDRVHRFFNSLDVGVAALGAAPAAPHAQRVLHASVPVEHVRAQLDGLVAFLVHHEHWLFEGEKRIVRELDSVFG